MSSPEKKKQTETKETKKKTEHNYLILSFVFFFIWLKTAFKFVAGTIFGDKNIGFRGLPFGVGGRELKVQTVVLNFLSLNKASEYISFSLDLSQSKTPIYVVTLL